MSRRVAITGIGVLSALGPNRPAFWSGLSEGRSGIRPIEGPLEGMDASRLRFRNGAQVAGYDPSAHFEPKALDLLDLFAQYALVAAREAMSDASPVITPHRTGIITGCCVGGQSTEDQGFVDLYKEKRGRVNPMTIPRIMANAGASQISMELGVTGPVYTISTACASANHAIGQAFWMVRSGALDLALTGGSEAIFSLGFLKAWEAMRVVAPDTCRPFSRDRKGLILGEGASILILEPLEAALARGARVYAEIAGFGMSSDAHHITQPSADGASLAMRNALDDARIPPDSIGYINAHGTGTLANDTTETKSIRQVFGPHASRLAVSSTKSMTGHALGAAGALEAAATALALASGILPPTANYTGLDPTCDLDVIPNTARRKRVEFALSNAFAFGGLNAVLVLKQPPG
jgi:nodulation protein E